MKTTDSLKVEHRVIERVLEAVEKMIRRSEQGGQVRPAFFLEAADFITSFADGLHHHKEEDILFTAMVEGGIPRDSGPIHVMLTEHDEARAHTRALRSAAEAWAAGQEARRQDALAAARAYSALLRQHIMKEDQILFQIAGNIIPLSQHEAVDAAFEKAARAQEKSGTRAKYLALADALVREAGA